MKSRQKRRLGVALLTMAMIATACGGGGAATPDANGVVTIELSEFAFSPGDITLNVGDTVTFVINNTGEKEHEWMVGRELETDEGFPSGFHDNFFEGMMSLEVSPMDAAMGLPGEEMDMDMDMPATTMAGMDMDADEAEDHGFMIMRNPGQTASITFTVTADQIGEWEMGCFEEDGAHYDDGMKGTLTVEG